jgi:signal transduction histidine kinase
VGRIKDNVKAITKIVDNMLQMADKESNELNTESGHIYCNQFLGNILYAHRSKVSANIELSYTTDVINRFQITTSKDGLRKILEQLIENAIKFTQRGTINVHCKQSEDQKTVLISVTDTGKGIAPENQEKVFEGFYKEDSFEQGIGLGLALSKKIAQKMGGDLVLDTEYTNGCKFILSLPIEN